MPVPIVVVELAPSPAPADLSAALITACSRAMDRGRCALVSDDSEGAEPYAIAIVSWQGGEQLRVRIEVGIRSTARPRWLSRTMSFRAADDPAQRWTAAGLTIATLVGEAERAPSGSPVASGPAPGTPEPRSGGERRRAPPAPTAADTTSEPERSRSLLEAAVRGGPGIESGSLRLGVVGAFAYELAGFPLQPWLSAGHAVQLGGSEALELSWTTVGLGLAVETALSRELHLRWRGEGFVVRWDASAHERERADSRAVWKAGGLLGLDGLWPADAAVALAAGVEGWAPSGRVSIRVGDAAKAEEPAWGWAGRLGIRFQMP